MFEQEQAFFDAHKDEFRKQYLGKRVIITGNRQEGVYDDDIAAYASAQKTFKPGTFMIKPVYATDAEYTRRYMSRVYV